MASSDRPAEIRALAGARALPPLLLVLYHYHEGHGYQNFHPFDVFVAKGYLWVEFFFALSGFILIHVYGPRAGEFWRGRGYANFLKARLSRLYPLHLATLFLMLAMMVFFRFVAARSGYVSFYDSPIYHPYATWQSFIANLFLVQAWHLFRDLSWNGVAWFVSVEFFLCLIFPIFLWLSSGGPLRGVALVLFGLGVLFVLSITLGHGLDITTDYGVVRGIGDFSVGVGLAMLYRAAKDNDIDGAPEIYLTVAQLTVAALFLYAIYHTGWSHTRRDFWIVPPLLALILVISFDRGLLARLFQTKPLLLLGEWSFAIYMGQTALLQFIRYPEQRLYPDPTPGWAQAIHVIEPAVLVVAAILWGWLLFEAIEKPANAALRSYFFGRRRAVAA